MHTITLFPNLKVKGNPYIQDFIDALNQQKGFIVVNPAHKNPLLSILPKRHWGDIFIFNWFESIPDFKYGLLQSFIAVFFVICIKLSGRKIVWILHNKQPHRQKWGLIKQFLGKFIASSADLIITHATDGIKLVQDKYPYAQNKVHFLHHPTKDKLDYIRNHPSQKSYDLLIWGAIAKYKGITEFITYLSKHPNENMKVCIVGKCASKDLFNKLTQTLPSNITLIHKRASFEELAEYISQSHFVLMPYYSRSILSSGILMDSLSFGAKIIGPHTGSFKDYTQEPLIKVYTFQNFGDIYPIVKQKKDIPISIADYQKFLRNNNWTAFSQSLTQLLTSI